MKVSLIILNWNRPDETLGCLKSLKGQVVDNFDLSVVVVDNGSTDNSIKRINSFIKIQNKNQKENINLRLIGTNENRGFAGGNNFGIKYSLDQASDFIIILNNDTLVDKRLIRELLATAKEQPQVGIISPKIYFARGYEFHKKRYQGKDLGRVIWYAGGVMDWNNVYGGNRGVDEVDKGQYDKTHDTDFATGACMLLRSVAVKAVGMFDEKYFMYLEDADLSQRMKRQGWGVLYTHKAYLWHKVAQSSKIGGELNDYFITRNRLLFGMRYASFRTKLALFRESVRFLVSGRKWQKTAVRDFMLNNFGKGSWKSGKKASGSEKI